MRVSLLLSSLSDLVDVAHFLSIVKLSALTLKDQKPRAACGVQTGEHIVTNVRSFRVKCMPLTIKHKYCCISARIHASFRRWILCHVAYDIRKGEQRQNHHFHICCHEEVLRGCSRPWGRIAPNSSGIRQSWNAEQYPRAASALCRIIQRPCHG